MIVAHQIMRYLLKDEIICNIALAKLGKSELEKIIKKYKDRKFNNMKEVMELIRNDFGIEGKAYEFLENKLKNFN